MDTDFRQFKVTLYGVREANLHILYTLDLGASPKLQDTHLIVTVSQFVQYHQMCLVADSEVEIQTGNESDTI